MDAAELEQYTYQLSQVKLALANDPSNAELVSLRDELTNLISLTQDVLAQQNASSAAAASSSTSAATSSSAGPSKSATATSNEPPSHDKASKSKSKPSTSTTQPIVNLQAGDECMARYSDGKFYPARVTSVAGSEENRVYSVMFKGYTSTELVNGPDVKPLTDTKKRALQASEEDAEREKKRKKNEKKLENKQAKAAEQVDKQKAWQSFAKKSAKKGVAIPGVEGKSMFRAPDNPYGKVGVTGSGHGMTSYAAKNRHKFEEKESG